jgi:outer membrane PBP1 activator LpoA protein
MFFLFLDQIKLMRRLPVILLAFVAAISVTSCKKKYLCECREDQYAAHQYVNQKASADYVKEKNRDAAERACAERQSEEIDENGYGHKTICSLK